MGINFWKHDWLREYANNGKFDTGSVWHNINTGINTYGSVPQGTKGETITFRKYLPYNNLGEVKAVDKKYEKVKSLSPESVWAGCPCRGEFANYIKWACLRGHDSLNPHTEDIPLNEVICESRNNHPSWLSWLIEHGYVREMKQEVEWDGCGAGDRFKDERLNEFMVARLGDNIVALVYCGEDSCMWRGTWSLREVNNVKDISPEEFRMLLGEYLSPRWQAIYVTRIPFRK